MQIPVHDYRRLHKQHLYPIVLLAECSSYYKRPVIYSFSLPADLPSSKKHYNHISLKGECCVAKGFLLRSFSVVTLRQQNLTPSLRHVAESFEGSLLKLLFPFEFSNDVFKLLLQFFSLQFL